MKKMKRMKVMMTAGAMLFAGSIGILPESVTEQFAIAAGAEESIVASGDCGEQITWTLDSEGMLTIGGEGDIPQFETPWYDYKNDIKSVLIEEGVTNIVWGAFSGLTNVTSVTIPASVSDIDEYAFPDCSSLTALHVDPENAEYTSVDGVLYTKDKTKLVKYPDNKEGTEYVIPASVEFIEYNAFVGCNNLSAINVEAGNTEYASEDGVLFSKSKERLIQYPANKSETEYVVPDGVIAVADSSFYDNDYLTDITLSASVETLKYYAFWGCNNLSAINVEAGNTEFSSIDGVLFNNDQTRLILYPVNKTGSEYVVPDGVIAVADRSFYDNDYLTDITLPDSLLGIEGHAFYDCENLTTINIPDAVTSIGDHAFYDCESLPSITLPEGITIIESGTFIGCKNLASVTLPETLTIIEEYAFAICSKLTSITIPESVTSIGDSAFSNCSKLTSITIPEGVTQIGSDAFYFCKALTSVTIPKSLTKIDDVFYYSRLENVYYAGTEEEWNAMEIDDEYLLKAKIHFGGTTPPVMGDIDSDDKFSVTDIIFVQKLLFGQETLTNWQAADLNRDDHVDGFDLAIMKRLLLNSNRAESDQAS